MVAGSSRILLRLRDCRMTETMRRHLSSHGYVRVKVGDRWEYEHRLVAEQVLARPLRPGETVHHRNGIKTDNAPDNLEVCASAAHHFAHHRKAGRRLRLPDEPNPVVGCACGCGITFTQFDGKGRWRAFAPGHSLKTGKLSAEILKLLSGGPMRLRDLIAATGRTQSMIGLQMFRLKYGGLVRQASYGIWALV